MFFCLMDMEPSRILETHFAEQVRDSKVGRGVRFEVGQNFLETRLLYTCLTGIASQVSLAHSFPLGSVPSSGKWGNYINLTQSFEKLRRY